MTLDQPTIEAIAAAVVRQIKQMEAVSDDIQYLASLPPEERKRRLKERRTK